MEKWAAAVVVVQSVPMSKFPMRSIRTGPRILITAIRMVTRDTIRDMVISVLNLRRKAAPYMLSTANSRTPKILVPLDVNTPLYSTRYPRQAHACEVSRSAHYAVTSQTHT